MIETIPTLSNVGWQFDNSYSRLPELMMSRVKPAKVEAPKLIILNQDLSEELGLNFSSSSSIVNVVDFPYHLFLKITVSP